MEEVQNEHEGNEMCKNDNDNFCEKKQTDTTKESLGTEEDDVVEKQTDTTKESLGTEEEEDDVVEKQTDTTKESLGTEEDDVVEKVDSAVDEKSNYVNSDAPETSFTTERHVPDASKTAFTTEKHVPDASKTSFTTEKHVPDASETSFTTEKHVPDASETSFTTERHVSDASETSFTTTEKHVDASETSFTTERHVSDASKTSFTTERHVSDASETSFTTTEKHVDASETSLVAEHADASETFVPTQEQVQDPSDTSLHTEEHDFNVSKASVPNEYHAPDASFTTEEHDQDASDTFFLTEEPVSEADNSMETKPKTKLVTPTEESMKNVKISSNTSNTLDDEREEGELEEGELEEEGMEEGETKEIQTVEGGGIEKEESEPMENETEKGNLFVSEEPEVKHRKEKSQQKKEGESKKRKHRDEEETKKKKKKKKHHHDDEGEEFGDEAAETKKIRKSKGSKDNQFDFDTLLQQEICSLVGSKLGSEDESQNSEQRRIFQLIKQYKDREILEEESIESCTDEERDEKRKPNRRKGRGALCTPYRKSEPICIYFQQGNCRRGKGCPYSHDFLPRFKMELCKFYMMDCCAKKSKCLYMHNDFPCKYFHFGMICHDGETCKFSHSPLQEAAKKILLKHIEMAPKDIMGEFPRVSMDTGYKILEISEEVKRGAPVNPDSLEMVAEFQNRGFQYLDKALRLLPPKNREKENIDKGEESKSPKKRRSREDDQKSDTEKGRERNRDKEREKRKESERGERDRERERDPRYSHHRGDNREGRKYPPRGPESPSRGSRRPKDSYFRAHEPPQHRSRGAYPRDHGFRGARQPREHPENWYSSEDEEANNSGHFRGRSDFESSGGTYDYESEYPDGNRLSGGQNPAESHYPLKSALPDIDVMYLRNVLSNVQNQVQVTQNVGYHSTIEENEPNTNPMNNNSDYSDHYSVISNDIKEVFDDDANEHVTCLKNEPSVPNRSTYCNPSVSDKYPREEMFSPGHKDERHSRDTLDQDYSSRSTGQKNFLRKRDPRAGSSLKRDFSVDFEGDNDRLNACDSSQLDLSSRDPRNTKAFDYPKFSVDSRGKDSPLKDGNTERDLPHRNSASDSKIMGDESVTSIYTLPNSNRNNSVSSIYDLEQDDLDELSMPNNLEAERLSLPFKVPMHTSAKEIDASFNSHIHIYYHLIEVDVPKPDFSRLKMLKEDSKSTDDPRLRKMFRRRSEEYLANSRSKESSDGSIESPSFEDRMQTDRRLSIESDRDPRKKASRDPRMEVSRTNSMVESTLDPLPSSRMTRSDPRSLGFSGPVSDSRLENKDPRLDTRASLLDLECQDPRFAGAGFQGNMYDNCNFPHFNEIPNMSNQILPSRGDPRCRPGLLGPGPVGLPMQLAHGLIGNAFLMGQDMGGPPLPMDGGEGMRSIFRPNMGQWDGDRMDRNHPSKRDRRDHFDSS